MPIQIGDLVTVRNNTVEIVQLRVPGPVHRLHDPIEIPVRKGLIFEVLEVYKEYGAARILPVDYGFTEEFLIVTELTNLHKCGRAVHYLYGHKKD